MTSPTTYSIASDSAYITNGTLNFTGDECTSITVDNSSTYCVRIKAEILKQAVDATLIAIPFPSLDLHSESSQRIADTGQRAETVEVRGYLKHTVEGTTNESAEDKAENLLKLAKQSENGLYLVFGSGSDQVIYGTSSANKIFIKKLEITNNAKELFALSDYYSGGVISRVRKTQKSVMLVALVGKNQFVKS